MHILSSCNCAAGPTAHEQEMAEEAQANAKTNGMGLAVGESEKERERGRDRQRRWPGHDKLYVVYNMCENARTKPPAATSKTPHNKQKRQINIANCAHIDFIIIWR